ncbi:MAG: YfhO family protein, partial [Nitrospinae bacterium]|nr:YfhO family protein [Nitrospinota bacterium]
KAFFVDIVKKTPNKVVVNVRNNVEGYFYYSDNWSKHWKAYDNGKEVPIYKANYTFKALKLGSGTHEIIFKYEPKHYIYSLYCYFLSIIISLMYFSFYLFNRLYGTKEVESKKVG